MTTTMFQEALKEHITKFATAPFLFIGSGLSRRYLNLPAWEALLKEMCSRLDLPKQYEYYRANANNYLPIVASLMGVEFNDVWWGDERYEASRTEFAKDAQSKYSPLKYEICKRINENSAVQDNVLINNELRLLKKVNVDGVITTNWDKLLENLIFPEFKTYVGQDELIFSDLSNIGEIYKIHGSADSGKHGKIDPVGTDKSDPPKTAKIAHPKTVEVDPPKTEQNDPGRFMR